jgi:hypothetical protein
MASLISVEKKEAATPSNRMNSLFSRTFVITVAASTTVADYDLGPSATLLTTIASENAVPVFVSYKTSAALGASATLQMKAETAGGLSAATAANLNGATGLVGSGVTVGANEKLRLAIAGATTTASAITVTVTIVFAAQGPEPTTSTYTI